jgi:hypothetical protein
MRNIRTEIIPDFYIGTTDTLKEVYLNEFYGTYKIINLEKDLHFIGKWKEYKNLSQQNSVMFQEKKYLSNYLISVSDIIYSSIESENPIFVCCNDCNQLSPLVAVFFLIHHGKLTLTEALRSIISKLPEQPFKPKMEHMSILKTLI